MPTVTALKPQKNGRRVNVYLDGKFGFGIDLDNLVKKGIKVEKEFSDEEIAGIIKKAEFQKTFDKIVRFASVRPRSEREINDWLKRKKVHESMFEGLFDRLKRLELIDDNKFALWWVEQRTTFRPRGKKALEMELRQKGIDREIIKEVLSGSPIDEEKMARGLLEKYGYKWRSLSGRPAKEKKMRFLASKGFGWDMIKKLID